MVDNQTAITGEQVAECVAKFRARRPHVHCLINTVAQNFAANVLLAVGVTPSMTIAIQEISDFVSMADALLINLGTMDAERTKAIEIAVTTAVELGKPWALDPVFVHASPLRLELAKALLSKQPSLVHCNKEEGKALFRSEVSDANLLVQANQFSTTIALTGKIDRIANEYGINTVYNGSPLMDRITAMGCALTAVIAGFIAVEDDHLLAATSAISLFGLAGERAEELSSGPGSFVPHFLDALSNLTEKEIAVGVKL
ncbi:MAG: hydroxyethylthiazole kinase [Rhizobiaceae bacterium]